MAIPVQFDGQDSTHTGPPPILDLPTVTIPHPLGKIIYSCWELSDAELAEVLQTKRVWLGCMNMQPPVMILGERPEDMPQ